MWAENYHKYLFSDINSDSITTLESCDKTLQNLFRLLLIGASDADQIKDVFIKVKNSALAEVVRMKRTDIETILKHAEDIGIKKNNDYGSENILKYGIIGIIVRLGDKISRYQNLTKDKAQQMVADEKVEDTLLDMINYATYGEMLSDSVWND